MVDKSTDHGNNVMKAQFVFLSRARAIFRETSTEWDVILICQSYCKKKTKKTNRQQFSTVFTVIDHRNVVSSKLKHFDVISMMDNSIQTMENCCRFVNFGKRGRLEMVLD